MSRFEPNGVVTLLTDFGDLDGFVGAMRGVVLSGAPHAHLVDLGHHVSPGDVAKARRVLYRAAPMFPAGTVHLVVVDPGVGTDRRPIAALAGRHAFVAPDNGVLTDVVDRLGGLEAAYVLENRSLRRDAVSSTFHGRDIFAPASAAIAAGVPPHTLGPSIEEIERRPTPKPTQVGDGWRGENVELDRFGNLITNLPAPEMVSTGPGGEGRPEQAAMVRVVLGGHTLEGPCRAYGSVPPGELVLLAGSEATLEIAVRDGSAAIRLGARCGDAVHCSPRPSTPSPGRASR